MLRVLCALRCAFTASHLSLKTSDARTSNSMLMDSHGRVRDDEIGSSASLRRAEALENLSNEVFGRGNRHLKNVETLTALPEGLHSFPEVCFIGKPNCGKSSLISCLLHNARLGKAGATGGTTRLLQFFNVGDALLLVDTPGYGGWKGRQLAQSLAERANAFSILFRYLALRNGGNLKRVYWLMEASARSPVSFQARDEELLGFLARERIPFSVVLTKIDRHWRLYADQQRRAAIVGKDGLVHPGHAAVKGEAQSFVPLPEEGVARNMREVFEFIGTDTVPILGVSSNRKQPGRSRNLELLQHDIVHYCTQDLLPGEALTAANLQKLSYAPPTADRIQEIQLRYPVESFVVPQNNSVSLAHMVEQHEAMKARFLTRNVSAARLTAKDVAACHLGSTTGAAEVLQDEASLRAGLDDVTSSTTFLSAIASQRSDLMVGSTELNSGMPKGLIEDVRNMGGNKSVSLWREPRVASPSTESQSTAATTPLATRRHHFRARPSLAAKPSSSMARVPEWEDVLSTAWDSESAHSTLLDDDEETKQNSLSSTEPESTCGLRVDYVAPVTVSDAAISPPGQVADNMYKGDAIMLQQHTPPSPSLPVMIDPNAHYVTAIDGTRIPRSMISVSVEQLAVNKEDELTHFATKSGAGAYEELLLLDQESAAAGATDPFTEASDFARLPEAAQGQLMNTRQCRTRSAARKQEERFLEKYVGKKRKERSIYMQAEGYMCPWVGVPEKRDVVRGLGGGHPSGTGGAVIRGLKQTGFGGKSYSARTMKNRGRATKKTGSWAA